MKPVGRLIASGRDSDIFDYGDSSVLRRARRSRSMAAEARIMDYARAHGYPVPAVEEISNDGTELVMERIDGLSMFTTLSRRPWTLHRQGAELAELHRRLHQIDGPDWIRAAPGRPGDRLLHLDLHPLNVILAARGPVVIDWTNACRGSAGTDVAVTWLLIAGGEMPTGGLKAAVLERARAAFVNSFLRNLDLADAKDHLREAVEWKVGDPNMTPAEQQAMWRLVTSAEAGA